jgi:hypothetical protein
MNDRPPVLTADEFDSLREVNKGDAQRDISQLHWAPCEPGLRRKTTRRARLDRIRHSSSRGRQVA